MLEYLQEWLKMRAGAAPVWAAMAGDQTGSRYTMRAVDAVGVVLSSPASNDIGVAFPWSAITSVLPDRTSR